MQSNINWILTTDRLPSEKEAKKGLLVYDKKQGVKEAEHWENRFWIPDYGQHFSEPYKQVICWANLPDPPKFD